MIARAFAAALAVAVAISSCTGSPRRDSAASDRSVGETEQSLTATTGYQQTTALPSTVSPMFDQFGASVAVLGASTVFVGDPSSQDTGFVNTYVPSGPTWALSQSLMGNLQEKFGAAMAASGSTLVVTSPAATVGRSSGVGSAQVYTCADGQCVAEAAISATDASASVPLGSSAAIDGSTIVLGATSSSQFSPGAVYVEVQSGTSWSQQAEIDSPTLDQFDAFGESVAISGDTLVVGDAEVSSYTGAAYVYVRSGAAWSQQAELVAPDGAAEDAFGLSVAIAGDTILVGAPNHASNGQTYSGAVYVFNRSGTSWTVASPTLVTSDSRSGDEFGTVVAMNAQVAAIGAPNELGPVVGGDFITALGAVYLFANGGGGWQQTQKLVPSAQTNNLMFGSSIALGTNVLAVGGPGENGVGSEAFVFGYGPLNGSPCTTAQGCLSTFCSDGVCCNSPCAGACDVCRLSAGASADGVCGPAPVSSSGAPSCAPFACDGNGAACPTACTSDAQCATGRYCDAGGACRPQKSTGSTCAPSSGADCDAEGCRVCTSGFCVQGVCCDRACSGSCGACARSLGAVADGQCTISAAGSPGTPSCTPYACDGRSSTCATACSADTDCGAGRYCGADDRCHDQKQQGSACNASAGGDCAADGCGVCATGFCADGACCDTQCTGQCEACNGDSTPGTCTPVTGDPVAPRPACSGTTSCRGTCDGLNAQQCAQPGAGTVCTPAACQGASLQPASTCDTEGNCVAAAVQSCGDYACDATGTVCRTTCATDSDCTAGANCDLTTQKCAQVGPTCQDAYDVRTPSGQVAPCPSGYLCVAGTCSSHCATTADCAPRFACNEQRCTPAASGDAGEAPSTASPPSSGGCGCLVGGKSGRTRALPLALAGLLILIRVRRRRGCA